MGHHHCYLPVGLELLDRLLQPGVCDLEVVVSHLQLQHVFLAVIGTIAESVKFESLLMILLQDHLECTLVTPEILSQVASGRVFVVEVPLQNEMFTFLSSESLVLVLELSLPLTVMIRLIIRRTSIVL